MKLSRKLSLVAVASLVSSASFAQQTVQWDSQRAILAGSGCAKDIDSFVTDNGNDLSIVFTRLGVDLPGGGSRTLAGRSSCVARVPATIAPGVYIGELSQSVSFGVTKTARTLGSLATRSTFFGFNVSPYTINLPYGQAMNEPLVVQERKDLFSVHTKPSWISGWCARNRAPKGLYQANIAVSGQKDSSTDDLIMFVDGLDLKFEVAVALVTCSL